MQLRAKAGENLEALLRARGVPEQHLQAAAAEVQRLNPSSVTEQQTVRADGPLVFPDELDLGGSTVPFAQVIGGAAAPLAASDGAAGGQRMGALGIHALKDALPGDASPRAPGPAAPAITGEAALPITERNLSRDLAQFLLSTHVAVPSPLPPAVEVHHSYLGTRPVTVEPLELIERGRTLGFRCPRSDAAGQPFFLHTLHGNRSSVFKVGPDLQGERHLHASIFSHQTFPMSPKQDDLFLYHPGSDHLVPFSSDRIGQAMIPIPENLSGPVYVFARLGDGEFSGAAVMDIPPPAKDLPNPAELARVMKQLQARGSTADLERAVGDAKAFLLINEHRLPDYYPDDIRALLEDAEADLASA